MHLVKVLIYACDVTNASSICLRKGCESLCHNIISYTLHLAHVLRIVKIACCILNVLKLPLQLKNPWLYRRCSPAQGLRMWEALARLNYGLHSSSWRAMCCVEGLSLNQRSLLAIWVLLQIYRYGLPLPNNLQKRVLQLSWPQAHESSQSCSNASGFAGNEPWASKRW